jgi:transcriptional regulator with XRE-family HTH domain
MGFKENLKAELAYKDLLVKELASLSGVKRRTIDNYLRENNSVPSADAAVRIANVLGVTVEDLFADNEHQERNPTQSFPDSPLILKSLDTLNKRDRTIVINLIKSLQAMEKSEKKTASTK